MISGDLKASGAQRQLPLDQDQAELLLTVLAKAPVNYLTAEERQLIRFVRDQLRTPAS